MGETAPDGESLFKSVRGERGNSERKERFGREVMMEPIRFACASCGRVLVAPASRAGRQFRCPKCGVVDRVPQMSTVPPPQPAAAGRSAATPSIQEPAVGQKPPRAVAAGPRPKTLPAAEPEDTPAPVRFASVPAIAAEMDMTPMVDVTFLLLIFFMVTAAYSLQKSLELPSPDPQEEAAEARTLEELEADSDYIIVRIGRDNTVWVNEVEAPSQQEVLYRLREARSGGVGSPGPRNLLVLADPAARHETVVMVLDAGNAVGMENIRLACIEEEAL